MKELQINEQIREREVRLIGAEGQQYGIISIQEARNIADEQGYDLCKMSDPKKTDNGIVPATCKLMDYGKYRYEQQKREKEAKKNQHIVEIKEIRLSATIDIGDTQRLAKQTAEFIADSNKVKASIRLKGRQQAHPEIAVKIVEDYIAMVGERIPVAVEKAPTQEGRMIFAILAPQPKK
ncbi:MAG: translation initiation factor IF-3 [Clostridia bacterium]|nr:translation initiation factor IF-3 [Clostridia bacterium]